MYLFIGARQRRRGRALPRGGARLPRPGGGPPQRGAALGGGGAAGGDVQGADRRARGGLLLPLRGRRLHGGRDESVVAAVGAHEDAGLPRRGAGRVQGP